MRVYELNGANGIASVTAAERSEPTPLRGQILIRMHAWSLNYRDLLIVNDNYGGLKPDGVIALSDGAGEVVAVGDDVRRFKVGDRVSPTFTGSWIAGTMTAADPPLSRGAAVDGVLAELVAVGEQLAARIPDYLTFEEAACLPCAGVTAWNALFGPRPVRSGDTVLTLGTGGVSTFAIQFAHSAGARVISTSSSDAKLKGARRLGAAETINYRSTPEWQDEVLRPHRWTRRRPCRGGRRWRHNRPLGRKHSGRRADSHDRRAVHGHAESPDADSMEDAAGHHGRLPCRPRGDEPHRRGSRASSRHRPGVPVRQDRGGLSSPRVRKSFWQGRHSGGSRMSVDGRSQIINRPAAGRRFDANRSASWASICCSFSSLRGWARTTPARSYGSDQLIGVQVGAYSGRRCSFSRPLVAAT
jgi:threonine dehydrogenase-like Zn-dependent dehydrogenase